MVRMLEKKPTKNFFLKEFYRSYIKEGAGDDVFSFENWSPKEFHVFFMKNLKVFLGGFFREITAIIQRKVRNLKI